MFQPYQYDDAWALGQVLAFAAQASPTYGERDVNYVCQDQVLRFRAFETPARSVLVERNRTEFHPAQTLFTYEWTGDGFTFIFTDEKLKGVCEQIVRSVKEASMGMRAV